MTLTSPKVGFCGLAHLGQTLRRASEIRGFDTAIGRPEECDIVFVTPDVEDHDDLSEVEQCMSWAVELPIHIPVVLVSQVPPGFTRPWLKKRGNIFYQVDTIIMNRALERATVPERFIVGCEDPMERLAPVYSSYLSAFNCPLLKMSFESAELSKLAINYYLAKQVETANELDAVARHIGADWNEMIPGLRLDARIGPHAYIRPGEVGGHLPRDVRTIERLLKECADKGPVMIIHNVHDGRHGYVGAWEVEPLDYNGLGPEHIGRTVIYRDYGRAEAGTITSWRDGIVFARYSRGDTAAGSNAADLMLAIKSVSPYELAKVTNE